MLAKRRAWTGRVRSLQRGQLGAFDVEFDEVKPFEAAFFDKFVNTGHGQSYLGLCLGGCVFCGTAFDLVFFRRTAVLGAFFDVTAVAQAGDKGDGFFFSPQAKGNNFYVLDVGVL
jgi:hypothetical protein